MIFTKNKEPKPLKTYLLPTFQELTYLIVETDKVILFLLLLSLLISKY